MVNGIAKAKGRARARARPRRRIMRRLRPMANYRPQTFSQVISSTITSTASTDLTIAHKVKFSDLPNYADFQKLFQQYKINYYDVQWIPAGTQIDRNNGTTFINVPLYYAIDYDQDATPTIAELLKFGNVKYKNFTQGFKKRVYPMTTITGSSSNEVKKKSKDVWLDTTNADQYHNGIDIAVPTAAWASSALIVGYVNTKICFSVKYLDGTNN